jgi:hypothetical protein
MIIFEIIFDEMIILGVFIISRNANICRIVYPQNSVGMLALSRFCLCAMSNGQHLVPIIVAYRSFSFSRWYTHMIHYCLFENPNFCIIVYPHNSLGILAWSRFCLCAVSNEQHLVPIMVVYKCFSFSRWYTNITHYVFFENTNVYIIVYSQNRLDIITWSRFCLCVVSSG